MTTTNIQIQHDQAGARFTADCCGAEAVLSYRLDGAGGVDFYRTFVPPKSRGHGLGGQLVAAAEHWARAEGLAVSASCWFAQKHLSV